MGDGREAWIDRLRAGRETFDLIVIGGGATGLGTALDAAARGYRTLLAERGDFSAGTSSKSTKLIHGGLRYLARGEIGLVRAALRERTILRRNAPQLVAAREFLVPTRGLFERMFDAVGLAVYDRLADRGDFARSRSIRRAEVFQKLPRLRPELADGGIIYTDGQFDDSRLAVTLARTVETLGGVVLNSLECVALLKDIRGKVAGIEARDRESGALFSIPSRGVVNATGVDSDLLRQSDDPTEPRLIQPSQGSHIVLDRSFAPGETALLVPKTDDGRVLFVIPWMNRTLVGTTDTPLSAEVERRAVEPKPFDAEIDDLLDALSRLLMNPPRRREILSAFAGWRPLLIGSEGSATARLSRDHATIVSRSGLVTITGGKWTTYRLMARDAVDRAASAAGLPSRPCRTESLRLQGWTALDPSRDRLVAAYGSDAAILKDWIKERPEWGERLHPAFPSTAAEVVWSARREWARSVADVLARRTRCLLLDARAAVEIAPRVANLLATELGRDPAWEARQVAEFERFAAGYMVD